MPAIYSRFASTVAAQRTALRRIVSWEHVVPSGVYLRRRSALQAFSWKTTSDPHIKNSFGQHQHAQGSIRAFSSSASLSPADFDGTTVTPSLGFNLPALEVQHAADTVFAANAPALHFVLGVGLDDYEFSTAGFSAPIRTELETFLKTSFFDAKKPGEVLVLPRASGAPGANATGRSAESETNTANGRSHFFVALGDANNLNAQDVRKATKAAVDVLRARRVEDCGVLLPDLSSEIASVASEKSQLDGLLSIRHVTQTLLTAAYKFDVLKKQRDAEAVVKAAFPKVLSIVGNGAVETGAAREIEIGRALANGQNYARTLKNLSANICSTDYMKNEMENLAADKNFENFQVIDETEMKRLGMGCLEAVGRGSEMPTYVVKVEYRGRGRGFSKEHDHSSTSSGAEGDKEVKPDLIVVGKGVVHDSGGLCLKPGGSMPAMKMDMGGSAAVLGTLKAISDLRLPVNVVGVVAVVENSVSGRAYRPGDVLKSYKGITVEVGNTDAEGRLALCDAMAWAEEKFGGHQVPMIDVATLTGAIVTSLGKELTGGFSNSGDFLQELENAGKAAFDPLWRMPLLEVRREYADQLKSDSADTNNIGGAAAGSITAALFLEKFVHKTTPWAHLDIAGTAMGGTFDKAIATGRPVPLLVEWLMGKARKRGWS